MEKINANDFIELEFVARVKETNEIVDITSKEKAKELGIDDKDIKPIKTCIGKGFLIKGLEEELIGKEIGKEYTIEVPPEKAFGKRDASLLKLVPASAFKNSNVAPIPGLRVNIEGLIGTIVSRSGGRILVDFNHPLAGKTLVYEIKATRKITKPEEKIECLLENYGLPKDSYTIKVQDSKAEIEIKQKLPEALKQEIEKSIKELVKEIKELKVKI